MKAARLVVLGVAVAAGGLAAILAGGGDEPPPAPAPVSQLETTEVLVANSDIGAGHALTDQDIKWQIWPVAAAGPTFIKKNERPDAIADVKGSITRASFTTGEPIQEGRLIKVGTAGYLAAILPSGMRAISVEVLPETGAGGFVLPGDHVDVILARRDKEAEKAAGVEIYTSETILTNVRVLAIDQTVQDQNGQKVLVGKTATLELGSRQAETLALARQLGTVSLALRSVVDNAQKNTDDDQGGRRTGVNMVRFGVTTTATPK
jgi:pilus assembly protein CpaB